MAESLFESGKARTAMPVGYLRCEPRGITQKDPTKITFLISNPIQSIPSVTPR